VGERVPIAIESARYMEYEPEWAPMALRYLIEEGRREQTTQQIHEHRLNDKDLSCQNTFKLKTFKHMI
jgi:hypothetical protein